MLPRKTINPRPNVFPAGTNTDVFPNLRKSCNRSPVVSVLSYQNVSRRKAAFLPVIWATPGTLMRKTNFLCNRNSYLATNYSKCMVH
jgi:hypothetical protein